MNRQNKYAIVRNKVTYSEKMEGVQDAIEEYI